MENAARFPHLHTPDDDYELSSNKGVTLTFHLVQKIGQVNAFHYIVSPSTVK